MLELRNLRKTYGATLAVDDVSFRIEKGQTLGLLGPNGAGKTTTVSIISGLTSADSGEVLIEGHALGSDTDHQPLPLGTGGLIGVSTCSS